MFTVHYFDTDGNVAIRSSGSHVPGDAIILATSEKVRIVQAQVDVQLVLQVMATTFTLFIPIIKQGMKH